MDLWVYQASVYQGSSTLKSQRANGLRDIQDKHLGRVENPELEVAALMTRRPRLAAFSAASLQPSSCVILMCVITSAVLCPVSVWRTFQMNICVGVICYRLRWTREYMN